ncbi:hypothetical protein [uncultured Clostridium sp.]|uniref:hypothetical protein n=1 Tax=uncultured Clostridium sp. TaxID=59620 RepID=UPI0025EBE408|nr:hypothetical protein [uncultured Clostridium sp.]
MFIRKRQLLTMIEVLNSEIANLKHKVSKLEAFLDSTESISKINSDGLIVKGKMNINGYKGQV